MIYHFDKGTESRRAQDIERVCNAFHNLPLMQSWRIEVREYRSQRSEQQNSYLNGVCYKMIGDEIGYERDEISEFLCGTYFGWKEKKVPKKPSNPEGIESVPIRTTTRGPDGQRSVLSKLEFADFVAFVQRFAAGKGVVIPDPEERR